MRNNRKRKPIAKLSPIQKKQYRKAVAAMIIFSVLWVLFAPGTSISTLRGQRAELASLQNKTKALAQEKEQLKKEIKRIQTDTRYLEEVARKDHLLARENEAIFEFSPPEKNKK
ncbi:MAG: hypothetical protein CSB24_07250 [Deltaproteobacteria bacterium]|nr:MAG: hypothetical protein CSB24_07250 [Deltaproteobacteria bacterium]